MPTSARARPYRESTEGGATVHRFLIPRVETHDAQRVRLPEREAKHARVRRIGAREPVVVFDGSGRSWNARIIAESDGSLSAELGEAIVERSGESPLSITLAVAALKGDRLARLIEKATELGCREISIFASRLSLARPSQQRMDRWRHLAVDAAKQCARSIVPRVSSTTLAAAIEAAHPRILCHTQRAEKSLPALLEELAGTASLSVLIGPEGGFSSDEIDAARATGTRIAGLGPRTLRADTAALTAVALAQQALGDL